MKKISEHLGEIVVALAGIALVITAITLFKAPVGDFFSGIVKTETDAGYEMLDGISPLTADQLQNLYDFNYYSSLSGAMSDANAGTVGTHADSNKDNAIAGIYTKDDVPNVVLLKDASETTTLQVSDDLVLNLAGKHLSFNNTGVGISTSDSASADLSLTIDGRVSGSKITITNSNGAQVLLSRCGTVNVIGGEYIAECSTGSCFTFALMAESNFKDCYISSKNASAGYSICIYNNGSNVTLKSCKLFNDIKSLTKSNLAAGIYNVKGVLSLTYCDIYSPYCAVVNQQAGAKLNVNGGIYQGSLYGGFYFAHGESGEAYLNGAKMSCVPYRGSFEDFSSEDGYMEYAFFAGGGAKAYCSNMNIYINGCSISGGNYAFGFRELSGEHDNTVYISNSRIGNLYKNKIDVNGSTMKIFIGVGCDFTSDDVANPSCVTVTSEVYTKPN